MIVEDQARLALLILHDHEKAACQVRGRLPWRLACTTDTTKLAARIQDDGLFRCEPNARVLHMKKGVTTKIKPAY